MKADMLAQCNGDNAVMFAKTWRQSLHLLHRWRAPFFLYRCAAPSLRAAAHSYSAAAQAAAALP